MEDLPKEKRGWHNPAKEIPKKKRGKCPYCRLQVNDIDAHVRGRHAHEKLPPKKR